MSDTPTPAVPPTSQASPNPVTPKPKPDTRMLRILSIVIGVLIVVGGVALLFAYRKLSSSTVTQVPVESVKLTSFTNDTYGMTFQHPSTWTKQAYAGDPKTLIAELTSSIKDFNPDDPATFPAHMRFAQDTVTSGNQLNNYLDHILDEYEQSSASLGILENTETKVAGVAARRVLFTAVQKDDSQMAGQAIYHLTYVFIKGNKGYEVTYLTLPDSYATHLPLVEKIVSTISVK